MCLPVYLRGGGRATRLARPAPHTTREGNPVIAYAKYVATTHVVFVVCRVPAREHMRSGSRRAGQEFGRPGSHPPCSVRLSGPIRSHGAAEGLPVQRTKAGRLFTPSLNESELLTPDLIRAFFPTGSKDQRCLVTFSETTIESVGPAPFCGARTVNGVEGVLITVPLEAPADHLYLALTLFQQFAKSYGQPTLYTGT